MSRRSLVLLLATAAIVFLYSWRLGARSFWEPDEPRYAEIGREMLVSGDWVVPRLNFVKYYEKPPLTYWVTTVSFALFGVGETQARIGPVLASFLLIAATFVLGRVFYGMREAMLGSVLLALFPLTWGAGRLLITDMFLSAGVAWALAGYAIALRAREEGRSAVAAMALSGAGLAAGVLAKSPVGIVLFLFGVVPFRILAGTAESVGPPRAEGHSLRTFGAGPIAASASGGISTPEADGPRACADVGPPASRVDRSSTEAEERARSSPADRFHRGTSFPARSRLSLFGDVGAGSWAVAGAALLALAAPWFVLISLRDRAFAWFFFVHEHLLRYATPEAHREGAPWYYILVLLVGLFPASILVPWAAWRTWPGLRPSARSDRGTLLLGAFATLTFLFFTASRSKLASYILPAMPVFALVLARAIALTIPDPEKASAPTGPTPGGVPESPSPPAGPERNGAPERTSLCAAPEPGQRARRDSAPRTPWGLRASLGIAALLAVGAAAAVFFGSAWFDLPNEGRRAAQLLSVLMLLLAAPLAAGSLRRSTGALRLSLSGAMVAVVLLLFGLELFGERLDRSQSVMEAALFVSSKAGEGDVVASYGTLLQGLTFYTRRRTVVVGGTGELKYGAGLEPTEEWFPAKGALGTLATDRRLWVVAPSRLEAEAVRNSGGRLRRVLDGPRFSVLTNVPPPP